MKYRPTRPLRLIRFVVRSVEANGVRGAVVDFYQSLFRSLRNRGIGGTIKGTFRYSPPPQGDGMPDQLHPFDLLHGTDTGGYISGASLEAISLSGFFNTAYAGVSPSALRQALSALPVEYSDFAFIDLGCGKGRALFVASEFPFRQLTGVELSSELCDIARANVATKPEWAARISIANQDATDVTYPAGSILIYLYNPFLSPILQRVFKNLERQLRHSPRQVYLLYGMNPRFTQVFSSFPFIKELSDTAYPFSTDEVAFDHFHRTEETFTLYSAEIN